MLVNERAHFGRVGSSSRAKYTLAAFKISFALRSCLFSRSSSPQPLTLARGQQITPLAGISLGLAHPLTQRLGVDTEISGYVRDRPAGLEHKPDAALQQLVRVLPRSWHEREFLSRGPKSSFQGLRQTRDGSPSRQARAELLRQQAGDAPSAPTAALPSPAPTAGRASRRSPAWLRSGSPHRSPGYGPLRAFCAGLTAPSTDDTADPHLLGVAELIKHNGVPTTSLRNPTLSVSRRSAYSRWGGRSRLRTRRAERAIVSAVRRGPAAIRELLSGCGHSLNDMPSRNDQCPCGSGRKFKRCCLERLEFVARELRARDELVDDVVAWLRVEHEPTVREALDETMWIRVLGGATGRSMSLVWALNDYLPEDGGPSLMARYVERPELTPPARAIARGLAEARLDVYRVGAMVPGLWLELEPLRDGVPVRLGWQAGLESVQIGEIAVARVVHATTMPTVWGLGACFPADTERRWKARLAALPTDPTEAALIVLGFRPDDVAEPIANGIELHTLTWSISDDEAVLEALEDEDLWESLGEAIPSGWAFAWPEDAASGGRDLGGWQEHAGEIEVARLIVRERDIALLGADRETLLEIAAHLEASLRGLIAPRRDALAA